MLEKNKLEESAEIIYKELVQDLEKTLKKHNLILNDYIISEKILFEYTQNGDLMIKAAEIFNKINFEKINNKYHSVSDFLLKYLSDERKIEYKSLLNQKIFNVKLEADQKIEFAKGRKI